MSCYDNSMQKPLKQSSAIWHLLSALTPYSEATSGLTFTPLSFFNNLEKKSQKKPASLRTAYNRAQKEGLITIDNHGVPRLSEKGRRALKPYNPKRMRGTSELMVIFDIPEAKRHLRRQFRTFLVELGFRQTQRSVWLSSYDHRELLIAYSAEHKLRDCIDIFEVELLTS